MAKNKGLSKWGGFSAFANSPKVVKLFGLVLVLLIVGTLAYGGYTLMRENSGDAASKSKKYGPWKYNSKGIKHQAGYRVNKNLSNADGQLSGAKGPAWGSGTSLPNPDYNGRNKYVWHGPGVNLPAGKQYLGCFFYLFYASDPGLNVNNRATLDIYDSKRKKVYNKYDLSVVPNSSPKDNLAHLSYSRGKFSRTCLAFFVPKSVKNNRIDLRVKIHNHGYVVVKQTKITQVPTKKNKLPNLQSLKHKDNRTIINSFRFN